MITTAVLLYISIFDYKRHRIQNLAIAILTLAAWFDARRTFNLLLGLITFAVGLFAFRFFKVGAGDIKLLTVLFIFLVPATSIGSYWIYFSLISFSMMIFMHKTNSHHGAHIPLAPALCGSILCVIGLW